MSSRAPKRTRWTTTDAQAILGHWRVSGLSLRKFAEQQGLQVQRLQRWKQALTTATTGFVEVPMVQSRVTAPVEVVLERGIVVRVSDAASIPLVVELLGALDKQRSC